MQAIGPTNVYKTSGQNGVAVSSTTVYRSTRTNLRTVNNASYQLRWGTNVGTFVVQVSNHPDPAEATDTDWDTAPLDIAITQPTGSNTGDIVDLSGLPYTWVRLKYTNASGTGTIHAWVSGKGA